MKDNSEILMGKSYSLPTQLSPLLNYSVEQRWVEIHIPLKALETTAFLVVDNNDNGFTVTGREISFTVESVLEESNNSLTTNILFPDFYNTSMEWSESITFRFMDATTGALFKEFKIWMENGVTEKGFSTWYFRSDQSTQMLVSEGAFVQNSKNKIADINLLAPIFALKTAGFGMKSKSADYRDITRSLEKYKHV